MKTDTWLTPGRPEVLRFGPFELQPGERRLLRDGVELPVRGRAFVGRCAGARRPGREAHHERRRSA